MNRTAIEYVNFTWNPVTGCRTDCWYCYARRLAEGRLARLFPEGFQKIQFHPERLLEPYKRKTPALIMTCSMADLFGPGVHPDFINAVLAAMQQAPWHRFILLTKWPARMAAYYIPKNVWAGITWDGGDGVQYRGDGGILHGVRDDATLKNALYRLAVVEEPGGRVVSFEPLLGHRGLHQGLVDFQPGGVVDWVIVGAYTGRGSRFSNPPRQAVEAIGLAAARAGIPVFYKDNLLRCPGLETFFCGMPRYAWPDELFHIYQATLYPIDGGRP